MADEIRTGGLGDILTSEVLAGHIELALADRGALINHPALIEKTGLAGLGSTTVKISVANFMGYDLPTAVAEGSSSANIAWGDASAQLTIARKSKQYTVSSLARLVDGSGLFSAASFAMDAIQSAMSFLLYQLAQLVDNFSNVLGTSGVDATFANFLDMVTALEIAKVKGPYLLILHPRAWGDIRNDIALNSGGAAVWHGDSAAMLTAMQGLGYQGRYFGVDVMTTTHVLDDGTDVWGGMFGRGALVYGWGSPSSLDLTADQVVLGDKILFERSRAAAADETSYHMHIYTGAVELIDAAGRTLRSDA